METEGKESLRNIFRSKKYKKTKTQRWKSRMFREQQLNRTGVEHNDQNLVNIIA